MQPILNLVTFKHISRWDYRFDFSPIPRVKRAKSAAIPPLAARNPIRDAYESFWCFYSSSGAEMQSVNVAIFSPFPANHLRFAYVINITRSSSSSSSSAYRKYSSSSALEEGLQKHCSNDKKTVNALIVQRDRGKDCSASQRWKQRTDNIHQMHPYLDIKIEITE